MTTARRLLAEATSLPWQYFPDESEGDELQDGHGEMIASGFRDSVVLDGKPIAGDAALIVYAVNRLPDYEALAEAVAAMSRGVDCSDDHNWDSGPYCVTCQRTEANAWRPALAALARLRDEVLA